MKAYIDALVNYGLEKGLITAADSCIAYNRIPPP